MRNALKVVVFLCTLAILSQIQETSVSAFSKEDLALTNDPLFTQARLENTLKEQQEQEERDQEERRQQEQEDAEAQAKAEEAVQPKTHVVEKGESLSKIADQHQTTWKRLFNKNVELSNPDILTVGLVLTIPKPDEALPERALPASALTPTASASRIGQTPKAITSTRRQPATPQTYSPAGNTYAPGYCTWYAKSRRPDLPNRMGNAISWVSSAAARGFATGSTPRAGAIGQRGNHVVYVESVNGDGTVTVSEMNYHGLYVVSSRTAPASSFMYIY